MIYFCIAVFLLLLSSKYDINGYRNKYVDVFVFILFVALAGFRYRIGLDTIRYESHFDFSYPIGQTSIAELLNGEFAPLYMLLQSLVKTFTEEFYVLQLAQAFIVNFAVFHFLKKNTKNFYFALFLYFILVYHNFCFEVMREACAVSMFLLSWDYFKDNKLVKYYFFAILGIGFHQSAILLLILPLIKLPIVQKILRVGPQIYIIALGMLVLGYVMQKSFFSYFTLLNMTESMSERISNYSTSDYGGQTLNIFGIINVFLLRVFFPLFIVGRMEKDADSRVYEAIIVLFICFSVLSIPITIFYRMVNYTYLIVISLYADYLTNQKLTDQSYLKRVLVYIPLILLTLWGFTGSEGSQHVYNRYIPYSSIFEKELNPDREQLFNNYGL